MSIDVALKHDFGGFALDAHFSIPRVGVTALFGPSGAGKTSHHQCHRRHFRPQEGRIVVDDRVLFDSSKGLSCRRATDGRVMCSRMRACFRT